MIPLDYDDIIHDQAFNNSFHQKIVSLQYNTALAMAVTIRVRSREKNINNLIKNPFNKDAGTENCFFLKIHKTQCSTYIFVITHNLIANTYNIHHIYVKHQFFKSS